MNRVTARGALRWPPRCVTAAYAVTKHAAAPHSLTVPSAKAALESRASSFWLGHAGITASGRAITRRDARWRAAYSLWLGLTGNSAGGRVISCRDADATRATNSRNGGPRLHYWGSLVSPRAAAPSRAATPTPPRRHSQREQHAITPLLPLVADCVISLVGAHRYLRERPRQLAPRGRSHQGGNASGSNTPSCPRCRWWLTASSLWLGLTDISVFRAKGLTRR